jgi:hypothetical protein
MKFTGEWFGMGRIVRPEHDGRVTVRLDDGRELLVVVTETGPHPCRREAGGRVCVSFEPGREPVLTGYLTAAG